MGNIKPPQGGFLLQLINIIMSTLANKLLLQSSLQIAARILVNLNLLITQLPSFFASKGPSVPVQYQNDVRNLLINYRGVAIFINAVSSQTRIAPTVSRTFSTRQVWFRDLVTVKNDILFLIPRLNAIGYRTINKDIAKKQIDFAILTYVLPYIGR